MADCGYPGLSPHRSLHEQLNGQTLEIMTRYTNGDELHAEQLAPLVCDWLTSHIELHDKSFVAYLHRREAADPTAADKAS
jgi:hemerythrin